MLTPEGRKQMLAASVEIKEMFQRYMIQYHMNHSFYSDLDHNLVGFHVENHVYGTMYYGFNPVYQDRSLRPRGEGADDGGAAEHTAPVAGLARRHQAAHEGRP